MNENSSSSITEKEKKYRWSGEDSVGATVGIVLWGQRTFSASELLFSGSLLFVNLPPSPPNQSQCNRLNNSRCEVFHTSPLPSLEKRELI